MPTAQTSYSGDFTATMWRPCVFQTGGLWRGSFNSFLEDLPWMSLLTSASINKKLMVKQSCWCFLLTITSIDSDCCAFAPTIFDKLPKYNIYRNYKITNKAQSKRMQHVARNIFGSCCSILSKLAKRSYIVQHGGQTHATCCVQQCCTNMLHPLGQGLGGFFRARNNSCRTCHYEPQVSKHYGCKRARQCGLIANGRSNNRHFSHSNHIRCHVPQPHVVDAVLQVSMCSTILDISRTLDSDFVSWGIKGIELGPGVRHPNRPGVYCPLQWLWGIICQQRRTSVEEKVPRNSSFSLEKRRKNLKPPAGRVWQRRRRRTSE